MDRLFALVFLFSISALARVENLNELIEQAQSEQKESYQKLQKHFQLQNQGSSQKPNLAISFPEMKAKIRREVLIADQSQRAFSK